MAVYVDGQRAPLGRMRMCHMVADSTEELLAMVDHIGVARRWIQREGRPNEHFDIALSKRRRAVEAGAVQVTTRQLVAIIREKRKAGP